MGDLPLDCCDASCCTALVFSASEQRTCTAAVCTVKVTSGLILYAGEGADNPTSCVTEISTFLSCPLSLFLAASPPLLHAILAHRDFEEIEYCPHCYNAMGEDNVKARGIRLTDPDVLEKYGGGQYPLLYADFAENGNYLEPEGIAVRHGVCGDPVQVRHLHGDVCRACCVTK